MFYDFSQNVIDHHIQTVLYTVKFYITRAERKIETRLST
jgi:hypothetical protein